MLKVSEFQKEILASLNLPKNKPFFEGFLPYEAGAEILQEKSSLFGRFEFTKISF